jgi:phosphatidyl-myo-inositol alpha-mannosyltransferase
MQIALVSPYDLPFPGGVNKHILNLARVFTADGHQVCIIAPSSDQNGSPGYGVFNASSLVVPIRLNGSVARLSLSPMAGRRLHRLLHERQFDVVHIHEPNNPTLPWVTLSQVSKVSPPPAVVGTFHAYREPRYRTLTLRTLSRAVRPLVNHFVSRLHRRIAVSSLAQEYASQSVSGVFRVIPNGVDVELFGARQPEPVPQLSGTPSILFVGRLEPRKGYRHLLQAFAHLLRTLPETQLVMVGPHSAAEQARIRQEWGAAVIDRIHFAGYVPDDELPRYYQNCQVLCAPSVGCESFGMVLLEAMAAGTPIVASDIAGYRAVMQDGRQGRLVPAGNAAALADALTDLLQHPIRRAQMGAEGRQTAGHYNWNSIASQVLDVYEEALNHTDR